MSRQSWARRAGLSLTVFAGLVTAGQAQAEQSFIGALTHGKPIVDLRARYEVVDDESCAACAGRSAEAYTTRLRLGYETAKWYQFSLLAEISTTLALGRYNDTRNGKATYPIIADPHDLLFVNRLQLNYKLGLDTQFAVGRQRINIGNQRFIGSVGWRDQEQTFDAFSVTNGSIRNLSVTYAYLERVNRIFGPDAPRPGTGQPSHYDSNSHIVDVAYVGIQGLKLEAFAFLLDLAQSGPSPLVAKRLSTATYGLRAEEKYDLTSTVKLLLNGEYANQRDYNENPLKLDLNYWLAEGGLAWKGLTVTGAFESLGSNGTTGFSTPLATLHAFNGWADVFLATPAKGLNDAYGKAAYSWKNVLGLQAITATAYYHEFSAARGGADYGKEWDLSLGAAIDKHVGVLAKYADFDGKGTFKDKSIFWLQLEYKL
jgi:hypothetical protein